MKNKYPFIINVGDMRITRDYKCPKNPRENDLFTHMELINGFNREIRTYVFKDGLWYIYAHPWHHGYPPPLQMQSRNPSLPFYF